MKTISEAASKKGRPRIDDEYLKVLATTFPNVTTRRGLQNKNYAFNVWKILDLTPNEDFTWLLDKAAGHANKPHFCKWSVLAELGRINDQEVVMDLARQLCRLKPSVKESVAIVRRFRLGKCGDGDAEALMKEILRAVDRYRERFPMTNAEQVLAALGAAKTAWDHSSV